MPNHISLIFKQFIDVPVIPGSGVKKSSRNDSLHCFRLIHNSGYPLFLELQRNRLPLPPVPTSSYISVLKGDIQKKAKIVGNNFLPRRL